MSLNALYRLFSLYGLVAGTVALLIAPEDPRYQLFACGQLALPALLAIPAMMSRPIRLYDPLNLLLLSMLIGTVIGSYMLAFGESLRRNVIMADWAVEDYATGSVFMLVSVFLVSIGYAMTTRRVRLERFVPGVDNISEAGLRIGLVIGAAISLLALASFVQSTGGLGAIGGKRAVSITEGGEVIYAAAGYLRLLASISSALLLMLLGYYLWRSPKLELRIMLVLGGIFVLSALMPILTSGRGAMLQIIIGITFVASAYRSVKPANLAIAAVLCLALFSAMTTWRANAQGGGIGEGVFSQSPIVKVAESGNGLAIASMTAVMEGVPERMPYQLGSTYFSWIFAPIPRSVWPAKPDISLGKRIKEEIYQQRVIKTGRPSSFMAEGYMNFGLAGFFLGSLAFGALLRLVANSFLPVLMLSPFAPALYYYVASNIAGLANSNLSQTIVRVGVDVVTFLIAYALIRFLVAKRRPRTAGAVPGRPQGHPAQISPAE